MKKYISYYFYSGFHTGNCFFNHIDTSENGVVGEDGSVRMSFFRAENLGFSCDLISSTTLKWDKEK